MSLGLSATPEDRSSVSIALLVGSLCFVGAVSIAEANPAVGYEVSIYDSTPLLFWIGIGLSLLIGVGALLLATSWIQWVGGLVLSGLSVLSVAALPLIRGYFFYGLSDSVRHLGAVRQLVSGDTNFFAEVYPGAYSFSGFLSALSGIPIEQSMLFVVFIMMALYTVFVVLCVRTILPRRRAVAIAGVSALLFLPLNQISFHPHFHTFSMATFFTPVLLYVVIKHITADRTDSTIPGRLSSTDLGFAVTAIAIVFYHPQVALNVIIILGAIAVAQLFGSRFFSDIPLAHSPPVYGPLLFLVVVFTLWNLQHQEIFNMSSNLLASLSGLATGTEQSGQIVTERVDSAESVGLGVGELFVKLFLIPAFYALVAGAVMVTNLFSEQFGDKSGMVTTAFLVSGVALGIFSLAHFVGDVSGHFFRHVGFGMVLVTILAAIGLTRAGDYVDELNHELSDMVKVVTVIALVVGLTLSILVIFPSPYLSQPTQHVSEQQYMGHTTAMEYRAEGAAVASTRGGPRRYATSMGQYLDPRLAWGVPPEALPSDLRRFRGNDFPTREFYYYIQTEHDERREVVAYRGLRYDESDFTGVGATRGVSQIMTNGRVDIYYVEYADGPVIGDPRIEPPVSPEPTESSVSMLDAAAGTQQGGVRS